MQAGSLIPGRCIISGQATVELNNGVTLTAPCKNQPICFVRGPSADPNGGTPPPDDVPVIEFTQINLTTNSKQAGALTGAPGNPIASAYRIKNNSTFQTFTGRIVLTSNNVNEIADVNPPTAGLGAFTLSQGDGDDFPAIFVSPKSNGCFPLSTPEMTISPTASILVELAPQEQKLVKTTLRSWSQCPDGSCAHVVAELKGKLNPESGPPNGERVTLCAGASVVVVVPQIPNSICSDGGNPAAVSPCGVLYECAAAANMNVPDRHGPSEGDSDMDGLSDADEVNVYVTDPFDSDSDDDGIDDGAEITAGTDPMRADTDRDGVDDGVEAVDGTNPLDRDTDRDGLSDKAEKQAGTDPLQTDSDSDMVSDGMEVRHGRNPLSANPTIGLGQYTDTDGDGLTDLEEMMMTRPLDHTNPDVDGDGLSDGQEVTVYQTSATKNDVDKDGLLDSAEALTYFTDPKKRDTDSDGLDDGDEINMYQSNPNRFDSDGDGLSDGAEVALYKSDPTKRDTDGGGLEDGKEVLYGLDPTDPADDDSLMNTAGGMVLIGTSTDSPSAVFYKTKTTLSSDLDTTAVTEQSLDRFLGRLYDTMVLSSTQAGQTLHVSSHFRLGVIDSKNEAKIHELQIGRKNIPDPTVPTTELDGIGTLELTTSPYTIFEFMVQVAAWTRNAETGELIALELEDGGFTATSTSFDVNFDLKLPFTAGRLIHIAHDIRGVERYAEETTCDDGTDNDNDMAIDCEDPDCDGHVNCAPPPPPMMTPMPPAVVAPNEEDGGCSCQTVASKQDVGATAALLLLAFLGLKRRRRSCA